MKKQSQLLFCTMFMLLFLVTICSASPFFSIGEGTQTSWGQAISSGNVRSVQAGDITWAAEQFYGTQGPYQLLGSQLTPDLFVADGNNEVHQSLVMSWDAVQDPNVLSIAAWEYVYDQDPDLTGLILDFSIFAPIGIWDLSVELIDINNNSRGWFSSGVPNTWGTHSINPGIGSQGIFNAYYSQPGFDLSKVVAIRFDEAGMWSPSFPTAPVGAPPGLMWNAWNHVQVTPEPSTLLLIGFGLMGLTWVVRRKNEE